MRREEIAALAVEAFEKSERVKMIAMSNQPTEYEARKQAAIEYAVARAEADEAHLKLENAISGR
jgi:hypothetical protein